MAKVTPIRPDEAGRMIDREITSLNELIRQGWTEETEVSIVYRRRIHEELGKDWGSSADNQLNLISKTYTDWAVSFVKSNADTPAHFEFKRPELDSEQLKQLALIQSHADIELPVIAYITLMDVLNCGGCNGSGKIYSQFLEQEVCDCRVEAQTILDKYKAQFAIDLKFMIDVKGWSSDDGDENELQAARRICLEE